MKNDYFSEKEKTQDRSSIRVKKTTPFPWSLPQEKNEKVEKVGCISSIKEKMECGIIYITNYRLHFVPQEQEEPEYTLFNQIERVFFIFLIKKNDFSIPLSCINQIEEKYLNELSQKVDKKFKSCLKITSKENKSLEILFYKETDGSLFYKCLTKVTSYRSINETFAYQFFKGQSFTKNEIEEGYKVYDPHKEFLERQKLPLELWRVTDVNQNYKITKTYPEILIVPRHAENSLLISSAGFRSKGRLPIVTWVHPNGCCMIRSSQPLPGITGSRNKEDEDLISLYINSCKSKKLFILDCRPKSNALANVVMVSFKK
jgi:hypothetical protein